MRAVAVASAGAVVALSVVARLLLDGYGEGTVRVFAYTDLHRIFFLGPVIELHWPYWRFPFEYHPLLGWGSALLSFVSTSVGVLTLLWGVVVAVAAAGVALMLCLLAPPRRVLAYWSFSPQLVVLGGLNFDAIAVLGLVAAAAAARAGRDALAGAALGFGTAAKLFPIAALPPLALSLAQHSARRAIVAVAGAAILLAVIDGPAILAPYSLLFYGHHPYHLATWNLDSIWTPVALVAGLVLDPAALDLTVRVISGAGLVLSYTWWVVRPALRGDDPLPLFWRAVVLVLLWSRLYSPQYSLWVLPAFVLFVPRPGLFALLALADLVTWTTAFAITQGATEALVAALLFGVLTRHAALVMLFLALRAPSALPMGARGNGAG